MENDESSCSGYVDSGVWTVESVCVCVYTVQSLDGWISNEMVMLTHGALRIQFSKHLFCRVFRENNW